MQNRAIAGLLLCGVASCASAVDSSAGWSGNVTLASQYVSRGFQQSWGNPALQAGAEYALPQGWYAGGWVSSVSAYAIEGGHAEVDIYAGKRGHIGELNYYAALYGYAYPGARVTSANTSYNYAELVTGFEWRQWSLGYSLTVSPNYFGDNSRTLDVGVNKQSRGSGYLDLGRSFELGGGYSFAIHYGWQRIRHFSNYNWQDASITLSRHIRGFDMALAYGKAWNGHGVYRDFTTGVADRHGRLHFSDPTSGTVSLTIGHDF